MTATRVPLKENRGTPEIAEQLYETFAFDITANGYFFLSQ